jgi:hypothetical protein
MRYAVLLFAALVPLTAQTTNWLSVQALSAGTEVRVTTSGAKSVRGQIQSVTADMLVINVKNSQQMLTRQETTRVSTKKHNHRLRNTVLGLGIGAGVGLAIGAGSDSGCNGQCFLGDNLGKEVFTPLGAAVGLIVGVVWPTGGWSDVYRLK